jgi:glycosyltransferase involved in cell wall biosynthesis
MGICDKMCREYEARYGLPFVPFHNVVEVAAWENAAHQDWSAREPFRIIHSGNIGAIAKMQSLLDICRVVRGLHSSGVSIELRIHTLLAKANLYRSVIESPPSVTVHDPPENEEFVSLLSDADLLVLPVDFGKKRIARYKYSMPTRVPAYMMSGTPILVYGPPEVAAVEYAQQAGWGYVVPQRDLNALREAITLLVSNTELRKKLGQRAQGLAVQNHDAAKVRETFRQALVNAAFHRGS